MKQKIGAVIGALLILAIIFVSIDDEDSYKKSNFGSILLEWGEQQEDVSEKFTAGVTSKAEGEIVGEYEEDGSNWSIPNIIRHWLGVD